MKYDLAETLNAALMNQEPVVIVEGQDDIKFYDNIALLNGLVINVQPIENIEGYTEGCEKVIEAITEAQSLIKADIRLKRYIMGIIDKDARPFRNTLPTIDN